MVAEVSLGCLGRPPGAPLGPSWPPTSLSWRALGRSWALLGRSWDTLGTLLGRSWTLLGALGSSWALLGRSWDAPGSIWDPPGLDFRLSWESPELLQEDSEQLKRTNANIPKVDRNLSENGPRRFRKPNPAALDSQLPPLSIAKKLGAGGSRAAN